MIVYSEEMMNLQANDLFMLRGQNEKGEPAYFYVDQNTYNSAVLLDEIYDGDPNKLLNTLTQLGKNLKVLSICRECLPKPLYILCGYLCIMPMHEEDFNVRTCVGMLSQLSMAIDFVQVIKAPVEVKAKLDFKHNYLTAFEVTWNTFIQPVRTSDIKVDSIDVEALKVIVKEIFGDIELAAPTSSKSKKKYDDEEDEDEDDEEDEDDDDGYVDPFAAFSDPAFLAELDAVNAKTDKPEQETKVESTVEVTPEEPVSSEPTVKSNEDLLNDALAKMMQSIGGK